MEQVTGIEVQENGYVSFVTLSPCESCGKLAREGDTTPWIVNGAEIIDGVAHLTNSALLYMQSVDIDPNNIVVIEDPYMTEHFPLDNGTYACTECYTEL